jgi:hypothetical protein
MSVLRFIAQRFINQNDPTSNYLLRMEEQQSKQHAARKWHFAPRTSLTLARGARCSHIGLDILL